MKQILSYLWEKTVDDLEAKILSCLEPNTNATFLDCGCDDGQFTLEMAQKIGTKNILGIEIIEEKAKKAESRGVKVYTSDLNESLPFDTESIDVIDANQVIEHLYESENFIDEIYRVLRRGGYAVISTESISSWHNILPLLFGWMPFSLTNVSARKSGLGNPLALHRGEEPFLKSWRHVRIYSYQGWRETFEVSSFKTERILSIGCYPLPSFISRMVCAVDKRHSTFLTFKVRKE